MKAKRIFDLVVAAVGIVILAPVLAAIALLIKLDSPGPIFFKQVRIGQGGKEFKIYKFRTMVVNAESLGKAITVGDDPRITKIGKVLRQYKLDELPQLFNVFRGEMSFVGARPEVPKYVQLYTPEQREVLKMPPGITDLASIKFRKESELLATVDNPEEFYIREIMPQKLALNRQYIEQASLGLDLQIIWQTLMVLWKD